MSFHVVRVSKPNEGTYTYVFEMPTASSSNAVFREAHGIALDYEGSVEQVLDLSDFLGNTIYELVSP